MPCSFRKASHVVSERGQKAAVHVTFGCRASIFIFLEERLLFDHFQKFRFKAGVRNSLRKAKLSLLEVIYSRKIEMLCPY